MKRAGKREAAVPPEADEFHGGEAAAASRQLPVLLHRTREALAVHFRKIFVLHDLTDPQWRVLPNCHRSHCPTPCRSSHK